MTGKIIKGIGGFYYIHASKTDEVYSCRAVGIFRKSGIKPLVGDNVEFEILDDGKKEGSLTRILERDNVLIRPAVANIDQAMVVFAVCEPELNTNLLDRFLIYMGMQDIPVIIFLNKSDLNRDGLMERYRYIYENAGHKVICGSTENEADVGRIREALKDKTTVLAGPSGVGKSSLTNKLNADSYVLDTPGFTSLYVTGVKTDRLGFFFEEFNDYYDKCKYTGCSHIYESGDICAVKRAVAEGKIPEERYNNYRLIYEELKDKER